jgi:hypothetical protein
VKRLSRRDRWLVARECVIGVGFLSGLAAEPITVASNAFENYFESLVPIQYRVGLLIAPYLLVLIAVIVMYGISRPHWVGLFALFLGFIAGVLTLKVNEVLGVFLAFAALFLGLVATDD